MRRVDRAVTDFNEMLEILQRCRILRLALQDAQGLYLIPLSFGFANRDGRLSFYIHSAREGRKVAAMTPGCPVAFELDCDFRLQPAEIPCKYSCSYASLTGTGQASPVTDPAEKALGLAAIMAHQTGQSFSFSETQTQSVAVFRIDVEQMTGKQKA